MRRPDQEPANLPESSILQNPAVIFDKVDRVKDRYDENDYEDVHRQFVEWVNDQWEAIREATQKFEIGQKVNDLVTYTGKSVPAPFIETITILCQQERGGMSIEFESFGERLNRVVITDWRQYTIKGDDGIKRRRDINRVIKMQLCSLPLEVDTETRDIIDKGLHLT